MTLMLITFTKIWLCVFGIAWILLCLPIKWLYFFRSQIRSWHHHLKSPRQIAFSANVVKFHNSRRPHIPLMERGSKNDKDVFFSSCPKNIFHWFALLKSQVFHECERSEHIFWTFKITQFVMLILNDDVSSVFCIGKNKVIFLARKAKSKQQPNLCKGN